MSEWKNFSLGDLCSRLSSGKNIKSKEIHNVGLYPVYGGNGIRGYTENYNFTGECAIIGRQGAYCGNVCFFSGKAYMTEHAVVVCGNELCDTRFLAYKLSKMNLGRLSSQSAQPGLSVKTLGIQNLSIPPLGTQKKIAAVLSALDDKIELNIAINKNLEEQAQAIYKNMFVDNFNPAWKRGTIENLSQNIVCGKTPSTKCAEYYGGNIPFITIPDMHNMVYVVDTERYLSSIGAISQSNKFLPVNSICVSCIGTAGLVSLTSRDSQTNQQINSIIPKKKISPYYVYYLMKSLCEKIIKLGSCGSTIVNLNKGQFSRIEVTIPPDDVMYLFNERVTFIFKIILSNIQENQKLGELRDALLPRLMSGEIDVSAVEI